MPRVVAQRGKKRIRSGSDPPSSRNERFGSNSQPKTNCGDGPCLTGIDRGGREEGTSPLESYKEREQTLIPIDGLIPMRPFPPIKICCEYRGFGRQTEAPLLYMQTDSKTHFRDLINSTICLTSAGAIGVFGMVGGYPFTSSAAGSRIARSR
jgi:hypothetical protein